MTTDYDAARRDGENEPGLHEDPDVTHAKAAHTPRQTEAGMAYASAALEPTGDSDSSSTDALTVEVIPPQLDEFTCSRCHLVHHRSQLTTGHTEQPVCHDCA